MKIGLAGIFHLECIGADGSPKWSDKAHNSIADEGEYNILTTFFGGGTTYLPSYFLLALASGVPTDVGRPMDIRTQEPDWLVSINPDTGKNNNGYSRQIIQRNNAADGWPKMELDNGNWMITSKQVTFTATADWPEMTQCRLFSSRTLINQTLPDEEKNFISYAALSTPRTILAGENLLVTYKLKLLNG